MSDTLPHTSPLRNDAHAPVSAPVPLPPTERELALLHRALATSSLEGRDVLLDQLRMLQVAPGSDPTTRIYLLHPDAPRSSCSRDARSRVLTVSVRVPQGSIAGDLSIWVDHGHLCALHYAPRHRERALTLPAPEWLAAPALPIPAIVRVRGAREALAGVRLTIDPPRMMTPARVNVAHAIEATSRTVQATNITPVRVPRPALNPWLRAVLLAGVVLALAVGAFAIGRSGGADLAAARSAGAAAGGEQGALHGDTAGAFTGQVEGERAGYASTWQAARDRARTERLQAARRAALKRRREAQEARAAAAAQARTANLDNTTCSGYRDARGYWICS